MHEFGFPETATRYVGIVSDTFSPFPLTSLKEGEFSFPVYIAYYDMNDCYCWDNSSEYDPDLDIPNI